MRTKVCVIRLNLSITNSTWDVDQNCTHALLSVIVPVSLIVLPCILFIHIIQKQIPSHIYVENEKIVTYFKS